MYKTSSSGPNVVPFSSRWYLCAKKSPYNMSLRRVPSVVQFKMYLCAQKSLHVYSQKNPDPVFQKCVPDVAFETVPMFV